MTENKKEKNLKNNNIVYVIEVVCLFMASIYLSIISATVSIEISLLCIVAASALFACFLFLTFPGMIIIMGAASFLITLAIGGTMINALASLAYIVAGTFVYFGVRSKKKRTQITFGIASVLIVFYIILIVFSVVISEGGFSAVIKTVDEGLTIRAGGIADQYYAMVPQYSANPAENAQTGLDADKAGLVKNIKVMSPAIFILYNALIAYLSTAFFKSAYNFLIPLANPSRKRIKNKYWRLNPSVVSAAILITSIILSAALFDRDNLLPSIVLTNIIYILAPGFCIAGIYFAFDKLSGSQNSNAGLFPFILVIGLIMFAFFLPFVASAALRFAVIIFMALGLYATLMGDIKKLVDKTKKMFIDDDDDDDDDYID